MPNVLQRLKMFSGLLFLLIFLLQCKMTTELEPQSTMQYEWLSALNDVWEAQPIQTRSFVKDPCRQYQHYIPDTNHLDHLPWRYVRINFHWMNSKDSSSNYFGERAIAFSKLMVETSNRDLRQNRPSWLPYRNQIPVLPTRYQYKITGMPGDPEDQGVYFHFDDELCYYIHKGKYRNLSNRKVFEKYAVQGDSVLNIFVMPHHPDSVASRTYSNYTVGVSLGNFVKLAGPWEKKTPAWEFRGLLDHEMGHVYGLSHAWLPNDGCPDTPTHNLDCWNRTGQMPCDTMASNNVMDYNAMQHAWTPCQIGKVQLQMANINAHTRKFLLPIWCEYNPKHNIFIRDSTIWKGAKDLEGSIFIEPGGQLTIECRVSFPKQAKIMVQPGGQLILNNAWLHNACNQQWEGIEVATSGTTKGMVTASGNVRIEDAKFSVAFDGEGQQ